MKQFCLKVISLLALLSLVMLIAYEASAAGLKVSEVGNKHNLSSANSGVTYYAINDGDPKGRHTQVCVFCHTPHNAFNEGQTPLWNRRFSSQTFQRYSSAAILRIRGIPTAEYAEGAQPNGSSKLCLSCHDGASSLGTLYTGAPITMSKDVIEGIASFNPATNKMKTGHHPVSFVYTDAIATTITTQKGTATYKMPSDPVKNVKLDKQSRMQCTTCHNPHQNQSLEECYVSAACVSPNTRKISPFWVNGVGDTNTSADHQKAVCLECHPMNAGVGFLGPWPYPSPP